MARTVSIMLRPTSKAAARTQQSVVQYNLACIGIRQATWSPLRKSPRGEPTPFFGSGDLFSRLWSLGATRAPHEPTWTILAQVAPGLVAHGLRSAWASACFSPFPISCMYVCFASIGKTTPEIAKPGVGHSPLCPEAKAGSQAGCGLCDTVMLRAM